MSVLTNNIGALQVWVGCGGRDLTPPQMKLKEQGLNDAERQQYSAQLSGAMIDHEQTAAAVSQSECGAPRLSCL
jgi:hypothetical protein